MGKPERPSVINSIKRNFENSPASDLTAYLSAQYSNHSESALSLLMEAAYSPKTDGGGVFERDAAGELLQTITRKPVGRES